MQLAPEIEIGLPTRVPYMRLILNPNFVERTPPLFDRNLFWLHVNGAYDEIRAATGNGSASKALVAPRAESADATSWTAQLLADLQRNTCNGTIAPGTNSRIKRYPQPHELEKARESLAAHGVRFEITPYPEDDGSFRVWVEYDRTLAAGH